MSFEDHGDLRGGSEALDALVSGPARAIRTHRAFGILKDIARAIGIPPAASFTEAAETRDLALADLCEAADRIEGAPAGASPARSLDDLRRDAEAVELALPAMPKLMS